MRNFYKNAKSLLTVPPPECGIILATNNGPFYFLLWDGGTMLKRSGLSLLFLALFCICASVSAQTAQQYADQAQNYAQQTQANEADSFDAVLDATAQLDYDIANNPSDQGAIDDDKNVLSAVNQDFANVQNANISAWAYVDEAQSAANNGDTADAQSACSQASASLQSSSAADLQAWADDTNANDSVGDPGNLQAQQAAALISAENNYDAAAWAQMMADDEAEADPNDADAQAAASQADAAASAAFAGLSQALFPVGPVVVGPDGK